MEVQSSSYIIRLTDMANVWTEQLERKSICMRAWDENTTIDPSDTPDNMTKFLGLIRSALDPAKDGHENTHMSLEPPSSHSSSQGNLTLRVTCDLPGFGSLKWPVYLKKSPASSVATSLVLPLVQAHRVHSGEVDSLINLLAQKDAVISKLLDKLETSGLGPESVFNALSGKKKVTRAVAGEKIKGLAPFDRREWAGQMVNQPDAPDTAQGLIHDVFGSNDLHHDGFIEIEDSPKLDNWWLNFSATKTGPRRSLPTRNPPSDAVKAIPVDATDDRRKEKNKNDDDDDFQVQSTPPHLVSSAKRKVSNAAQQTDDQSTESEDDAAPERPKAKAPSLYPSKVRAHETRPTAPRLGSVNSSKKSAPKVLGDDEPETASDISSDDDATASEAESPPPSPPRNSVPPAGRLGRIGGVGRGTHVQPTDRSDPASGSGQATTSPVRPPKLGAIGSKSAASTTKPSAIDGVGAGARGRPQAAKKEADIEGSKRETSLERADRRREELKRELEKKAAAGPAKKKRKF
jgi:hypothetical protein